MINKNDVRTLIISLAVCGAALASQGGKSERENVPAWLKGNEEILEHLTLVDTEDGAGGTVKTIQVTGVNLQIVNGLGATNGLPNGREVVDKSITRTNGAGNLIIGYNEVLPHSSNPSPLRTGSHNLIGGIGVEYTSFGGIVFGRQSRVKAPYSSVLGGVNNKVRGLYSVIVGGGGPDDSDRLNGNCIDSDYTTIAGGASNVALGQLSFIGGGINNKTSGTIGNSILGGSSNVAAGSDTTVCGGRDNRAAGRTSHVCGGQGNHAVGNFSSVSGGLNRNTFEMHSWRAGELVEDN